MIKSFIQSNITTNFWYCDDELLKEQSDKAVDQNDKLYCFVTKRNYNKLELFVANALRFQLPPNSSSLRSCRRRPASGGSPSLSLTLHLHCLLFICAIASHSFIRNARFVVVFLSGSSRIERVCSRVVACHDPFQQLPPHTCLARLSIYCQVGISCVNDTGQLCVGSTFVRLTTNIYCIALGERE